ncbi:MAG TPA: leucyl aminopeptidase family protein [Saliniramus sp.]|nr:leucyl aminopeptidase family protein [Saliniramus sp.]
MSHPLIETDRSQHAIPVHLVDRESWPDVVATLPAPAAAFAKAKGFSPKAGEHCILPDENGAIACVVFGIEGETARHRDAFLVGKLPKLLPEGLYAIAGADAQTALAWLLGAYEFDRYRKKSEKAVRLLVPDSIDTGSVARIARAVCLGRDLINTPANDLGPEGIAAAATELAHRHGALIRVIEGEELLAQNFPMIHAVGRASPRAPRLIDITWGRDDAPKVTLVGKGVAFDTGGLNIKPGSSMTLMKKDMGGAAAAIAAADMIMGAGLNLRLRLLVPAVENAIDGSAFRPGDILDSRKGLTVEIGNTDAEGRLILADALALADEEEPDLVIDFATLTGSARVALGPDLPPFMTDDDALAADLGRLGEAVNDPVWRLPLWRPYEAMLRSKIADINHISGGTFAGSITAALFLRRFVEKAKSHVHFDIFGWVPSTRPGRPEGGEPQAARLVYALLSERYPA